jgi:single-strand DNA-binding protein
MAGLNKVLLIGNLVRDPEIKHLPNGTPKCEMRLATSRSYTTNGEKREDTCFVDVIAWSRTAENCQQYLRKGSKVFVEGRLDYQEWEAQDGSKRSKHQVVAIVVQFLDSRNGGGQGGMPEDAGEGQEGGGAPRYQRSYNSGQGGQGGGQGNRPTYAPKPTYAPSAEAHSGAPAQAQSTSSSPAATGVAPKSVSEGMGIADDDIPF